MKRLIFSILLGLISITVIAQEAYFQVITCKGVVVFEGMDGETKTVIPGSKIPAE